MEEKKNNKSILVRLDKDLHKRMRHLSIETGISVNEYVVKALKEILDRYEKGQTDGKQ